MAFRLLIAEDDFVLGDALTEALDQKGYETQLAADGKEALDLLKQQQFDLLLTDLIMPNVDGFDLIREITALGLTMPIAVITNLMRPGAMHELEGMHIDRHFIKADTSLEEIIKYVEEQASQTKASS